MDSVMDNEKEEKPRSSKILKLAASSATSKDSDSKSVSSTSTRHLSSQINDLANEDGFLNQLYTPINPLTIDCILDVLFSHLKYQEIKDYRLVCKKWDEIGVRNLAKKTNEHIVFSDFDDFEPNGKLDKLIDETVNKKLFTSFKFEADKLQRVPTQSLERFVRYFQPHLITIEGEGLSCETSQEQCSCLLQDNVFFLLTNTSNSLCVFEFNARIRKKCAFKENPIFQDKLKSTPFPHLRKLAFEYINNFENEQLNTCFGSIIGSNSPNLKSLIINIPTYDDKSKFVDLFKKSGLASKLEELEIVNISHELIDSLSTLGELGLLKLKKLIYNFDYTQVTQEWANAQIKFFSTQSESLESLELQFFSVLYRNRPEEAKNKHPYQIIFELQERANVLKRQIMGMVQNMPLFNDHPINLNPMEDNMLFHPVQFPIMKKIKILQIDNLKASLLVFKTLHFSSMFPSLTEFKTSDISTLISHCKGGELFKKLTLVRDINDNDNGDEDDEEEDKEKSMDFVNFGKFFPNLEYIELPGDLIPSSGSIKENISFWIELKGIVVILKLDQLMALNFELMKVVKHFEIEIDCSSHITDADDHQVYHEIFLQDYAGPCSYKYNRYRKYLSKISRKYSTINPRSITFTGVKFADSFKKEFRTLFTIPVKFIETDSD